MERIVNPFAESTTTEHIAPEDFVRIFSPSILENAEALFLHGNVVLKGTPGSGKSMLLALLKPETRMAYCRDNRPFPVSFPHNKFISAGINLTRVGTQDFGNRLATEADQSQGNSKNDLALFFADFFNYYLVFDLLRNILKFKDEEFRPIRTEIGLTVNDELLNKAALSIASDPTWFGYLNNVDSFDGLIKRIEQRLVQYRSYFNFNVDNLPVDIQETKTAVGEPIAVVANILRQERVIAEDTYVFIRVDQVEELYHLESHYGLGSTYRQIINKALAMRDRRISYRLGTRGYAWDEESLVYGTGSKLEQERDYTVIEIDNILRRAENRKVWRFPELAADIFRRRLESAGYRLAQGEKPLALLKRVFGVGLPREELAIIYAGSSPDRVLDLDPEWPEAWQDFLKSLAHENPLSAKLGEAWARQRGKQGIVHSPPPIDQLPWDQKKWWKKERQELALTLIASRAGQRIIWSGVDDILELSGGNALVFITICRQIWQALLRSDRAESFDSRLPTIDWTTQAIGVYDASKSWAERVIPRGFNGDTRARVINRLGTWFAKSLSNDKAMSNPGNNGISVTLEDLYNSSDVRKILFLCSDFGDIVAAPHTTKLSDKKPRMKWYLAPILSPYFRIPHIHTKEPIYTTCNEIASRLKVEVSQTPQYQESNKDNGQLPLFS
jgi:hypothetical protein